MINYTPHKTKVHKILPTDNNFSITDEFIVYQRAAIHFDQNIPHSYAKIVIDCINNGWIKPVAYITEREKLFIGLSENNGQGRS